MKKSFYPILYIAIYIAVGFSYMVIGALLPLFINCDILEYLAWTIPISALSIFYIVSVIKYSAYERCVVMDTSTLFNNMRDQLPDGTPMGQWSVECDSIQSVQQLSRQELIELFPLSRARAGILITLKDNSIRYIAVGKFLPYKRIAIAKAIQSHIV